MLKQTRIILSLATITALFSGIFLLPLPGCTSDQGETADASNENIEVLDLEDTPPEDNGNPKLDSTLNDLIRAEEQGKAEEFARQRSIELIDGRVTVIIECEPGQAEAVAAAASALGNVELSIRDLIQVVLPITNLAALADIPGVHLVRLPVHPVEND